MEKDNLKIELMDNFNKKNGETMYRKVMFSILALVLMVAVAGASDILPISHQAIDGPIEYEPVVYDIAEDVIYYDGAPSAYWGGLTVSGTMFATRFTPPQPCSLSYIQITSYNGAGNATIHIMSDDGGNPDADLITPFTAALNGNTSRQSINLPNDIDLGSDDFHIVVEYVQAPPPFVTGDNDGNTENRSKYKQPSDVTWTPLDGDLNFRAWVNYYGDDLVGPTINHIQQVLGFEGEGQHPISATITDASDVAAASIFYTADGTNWNEIIMTNSAGDVWDGVIPGQSAGDVVLYYISSTDASSNSNVSYEPESAPSVPYIMNIVEGAEIAYDDGSVDGWWIVSDEDDDNKFAIRMTPSDYPAQVLMARAYVSDTTRFDFTINEVSAGNPGDVLPGGEAVEGQRESHGWAISEFSNGPTIESGHFYLVFNWRSATPGNPGVGQDTDNVSFRSSWYSGTSGWNMVSDGEYMMRVVVSTPTGIKELDADGSRPASYELVGNYPNPFNPTTDIKFLAPEAGNVRIDIYNVTGQKVKTVLDEYIDAGVKAVTWDGTNSNGAQVNSGVYFYKLTAGDVVQTNKMVLMK